MTRYQARCFAMAVAGIGLYLIGFTRLAKSVRQPALAMEPWTEVRQAEWEATQVEMRKAQVRVLAEDLREQGLVVAEAPG